MAEQRAHDGTILPAIGLGTYRLNGMAGADAVSSAIRSGYRLIDSAFNYENEGAVGRGVRQATAEGIERSEILVTSKLPGRRHGYEAALRTVEESVYRMGGDAIDLYLIHWPNPGIGRYVEAWRALVEARESGLVRHIGVSNFLPEHLERIEAETGVRPIANQIEMHPFFPQEDSLEYHRERGIIVEAWSPVGRGGAVLEMPILAQIAARHGASVVQTILAWHVARGVVPLPKSVDADRQLQNLAAADIVLTPEEITAISALGRTDGRINDQDPAIYEEL